MKYWVLSQGENPVRLFFDEHVAKQIGAEFNDAYLDVFDADGNKIEALKYKCLNEGEPGKEDVYGWTNDF